MFEYAENTAPDRVSKSRRQFRRPDRSCQTTKSPISFSKTSSRLETLGRTRLVLHIPRRGEWDYCPPRGRRTLPPPRHQKHERGTETVPAPANPPLLSSHQGGNQSPRNVLVLLVAGGHRRHRHRRRPQKEGMHRRRRKTDADSPELPSLFLSSREILRTCEHQS